MRGLKNEAAFVEQALDWESNVRPDFKDKYCTPRKSIEEGEWGARCAIALLVLTGQVSNFLLQVLW